MRVLRWLVARLEQARDVLYSDRSIAGFAVWGGAVIAFGGALLTVGWGWWSPIGGAALIAGGAYAAYISHQLRSATEERITHLKTEHAREKKRLESEWSYEGYRRSSLYASHVKSLAHIADSCVQTDDADPAITLQSFAYRAMAVMRRASIDQITGDTRRIAIFIFSDFGGPEDLDSTLELEVSDHAGYPMPAPRQTFPADHAAVVHARAEEATHVFDTADTDLLKEKAFDLRTDAPYKSLVAAPLLAGGRSFGVVTIDSTEAASINDNHKDQLSGLAKVTATGLLALHGANSPPTV